MKCWSYTRGSPSFRFPRYWLYNQVDEHPIIHLIGTKKKVMAIGTLHHWPTWATRTAMTNSTANQRDGLQAGTDAQYPEAASARSSSLGHTTSL